MKKHKKKTAESVQSTVVVNKSPYLAMAFIIVLVFLVFGRSVTFDYIASDVPNVVFENPNIMTGLLPENILWSFTTPNYGLYMPLPNLTFMLDSDLFGDWVGGFHLMTVAWHALCMCIFFWVMFRLTGQFAASFAATLIMSVHPLQIITVCQVAPRLEIMQAVFMLLSIEAYRRYVTGDNKRAYGFSLLFMLLSLMCKQMVVVLPCILLLLDYWPLKRFDLSFRAPRETVRQFSRLMLEKAPFFVLSLVGVGLAFYGKAGMLSEFGMEQMTLTATIYQVITGYARYWGHWAYPLRIGYFIIYGEMPSGWLFVSSALLLLVITLLAVTLLSKRPYVAVGWFWFLGCLFPVSGVVRYMIEPVALRYMYVAGMGLYVVLSWGLFDISQWLSGQKRTEGTVGVPWLFGGVTAVITLTLVVLTSWQAVFFRDTEAVGRRMLAISDGRNPVGHHFLSLMRIQQGLYDQAEQHLREAVALAPKEVHFRRQLASGLLMRERYEEAYEIAAEGLEIHPDDVNLLVVMGMALSAQAQFEEAEPHFRRAVELEPDDVTVLHGLAYCLALQGQLEEAKELNEKTLEMEPEYPEALELRAEIERVSRAPRRFRRRW